MLLLLASIFRLILRVVCEPLVHRHDQISLAKKITIYHSKISYLLAKYWWVVETALKWNRTQPCIIRAWAKEGVIFFFYMPLPLFIPFVCSFPILLSNPIYPAHRVFLLFFPRAPHWGLYRRATLAPKESHAELDASAKSLCWNKS